MWNELEMSSSTSRLFQSTSLSLFINKDQQQLATKVKYLKAQRENCGSREKSIDTNPEPFLLVMPGVCLKIQTPAVPSTGRYDYFRAFNIINY